jgi:hypothetical protein
MNNFEHLSWQLTPVCINTYGTVIIRGVKHGYNFTFIIILSVLVASYIGPEPALQAEIYPINIRNEDSLASTYT